jgi:hypothetical protein
VDRHEETAKPNYEKYAGIELRDPGVLAQILAQLSCFRARELALVLIAAVALAKLYKNDLSETELIVVVISMLLLGIADSLKQESNAAPSSKAVEGKVKPRYARGGQGTA